MGIQMIVKKAFRPGGSGSALREPGSRFVADSESQAELCRAMGWCEDAPARAVETRALDGSPDGGIEPRDSGTYATRVMTAASAKTVARKTAAKKTAKRDA